MNNSNLNCKRCFENQNLTQIEGTIICKGCIVMEKIDFDSRKRLKKIFEPPKTRWTRIRDWIINYRNDIFSIANLILLVASLIVTIITLKKN